MKFKNTIMNSAVVETMKKALQVVQQKPKLLPLFYQIVSQQNKRSKIRAQYQQDGIQVPPYLLISATHHCNLDCQGCYAKAFRPDDHEDMDDATLTRIIQEAVDAGIAMIFFIGGEPFMRASLLDILSQFPEIPFPIFTNGMMLDETLVQRMEEMKNIIPIISIEGDRHHTDTRRGCGVYDDFQRAADILQNSSLFWGVSVTVNNQNIDHVLSKDFIDPLIDLRANLIFYSEYVPVLCGTEPLILSGTQRNQLSSSVQQYNASYQAVMFTAFPGDEAQFGGCVASGRGFAHINASGGLEPCPFAPYSDISLQDHSLLDALQSPFLAVVRKNERQLETHQGGCALWENREAVEELLRKQTTR